jgi:hypothetical protein
MLDLYGNQASVSHADIGSLVVVTEGNVRQSLLNSTDFSKGDQKEQDTKEGLEFEHPLEQVEGIGDLPRQPFHHVSK